jgi:hypothetical protein
MADSQKAAQELCRPERRLLTLQGGSGAVTGEPDSIAAVRGIDARQLKRSRRQGGVIGIEDFCN